MNILSTGTMIFVFFGLLVYYLIPQRLRRFWLLLQSGLFIAFCSPLGPVFVLGTSLAAYLAARRMPTSPRPRRLLLGSMGLCLLILLVLKYVAAWLPQAPHAFIVRYLYPIGLSYYTLQLLSYLLDVYWGRIEPERDFSKLLLFVCFYPQLIQGPISKYSELGGQLLGETPFSWKNLKYGVQLMLWGFFKKMVIADQLAYPVQETFWSGNLPSGFAVWVGLFFYSIQLYCDFSGGIDIVRGIAQCYGIGLKENFRQPYFAQSLGEFWRRWHISLGEWMKDYVFYPISTSKGMAKLKKRVKAHSDRKTATRVSIALADIAVFALVGLWHGTGTNYLAWGLYNGLILAMSALLEDRYRAAKAALHIPSEHVLWKGFCIVRTFLIVLVGNAFDCASDFTGALRILAHMVNPRGFFSYPLTLSDIAIRMGVALIAVDLLHEKGLSVRDRLNGRPYWVQLIFWTFVLQIIVCYGKNFGVGGFMYANF